MTFTVALAGASGYAGGEMLRLLAGHPEARIKVVTGQSSAGRPLGEAQPHLGAQACLGELIIEPTTANALAGHDVIFLALPHGQSAGIAKEIEALSPRSVLVDLGADHRLTSSQDWATYYGGEHAAAWTYGMPELLTGWFEQPRKPTESAEAAAACGPQRPSEQSAQLARYPVPPQQDQVPPRQDQAPPKQHQALPRQDQAPPKQRRALVEANRIAVPGCNVTAVSLALAPGIASGLLDPTDLVAVLANGVSGAGRALKSHLMAAEILGSASPYAVGGGHRHIPEILQNLRLSAPPAPPAPPVLPAPPTATISFTPTLVPMSRGILATVTARPGPAFDESALRPAWQAAYGDERFVGLLPPGLWPSTGQTLGSNCALMQLTFDPKVGRVIIVAALDNLVKGTAGAALQSVNLALGLPEATGLTQLGVAP